MNYTQNFFDLFSYRRCTMTQIHLMGTNTSHTSDFIYRLNGNQDWWLIIQTQTPAEFFIDNTFVAYPENQIVLYPPYTKTMYRACSETYQDNWVRFYTTDTFITDCKLPYGTPIHAVCSTVFHQIFQLLASETILENEYKEESIHHLFHLLINKMLEAYQNDSAQFTSQGLLNLHLDIQSNPSYPWTVPLMAKQLHVSSGYLQSIYKKAFHVSCMEDVIQSRILLAKDYLLHGSYTISQIAALCGYQNTEHFSRQFHKIVGITPKQFQLSQKNK